MLFPEGGLEGKAEPSNKVADPKPTRSTTVTPASLYRVMELLLAMLLLSAEYN